MPNFISWKFIGFRDTLGRFTRGSAEARRQAQEIARACGRLIVAEMKKLAPVGTHYRIDTNGNVYESRPATLQKSIKFRTSSRAWGTYLQIYAAEHIKYVIYPTRPHAITARNATFLRFYWPNAPPEIVNRFGGNVVYFKSVWHPGTKGNPFHERAVENLQPQLRYEMNKGAAYVKQTMEGA